MSSFLNSRFFKAIAVMTIASVYGLIILSSSSLLVMAQDPFSFEINLVPQAEYAIVGQPFAYTIVVTNTSQTPAKDIVVKMNIPEGASFLSTNYTNVNWYAGGVQPGNTGEFIWLTQELVAPSEVITFELLVKVLPKIDQQLVGETYVVTTIDDIDAEIASGPSIRTQVLLSAPTPTASPSPTTTATNTPAPTTTTSATPTSQVTPDIAKETPTVTSVVATKTGVTDSASSTTVTTAQEATRQRPLSTIVSISIGFSVLVIVSIGLIWFLKYR